MKSKIYEKIAEIFDPVIAPLRRLMRRIVARIRNAYIRMRNFRFRTARPTLLPEQEMVEEPVLFVPTAALS